MKKILKFFLYLILFIVILVVGYFVFLKFFASKGSVDAFNTVPKEAVFIVETTNLSQAWTQINSSDLWQHLVQTEYFADLNEDIEMVNKFLNDNKIAESLLKNRKLLVAGIITTPKEWDFLFSVDLEKGSSSIEALNGLVDVIEGYDVTRSEFKNDNKKFEIIQLTDKKDPSFKIFATFADNIILVSFNGTIIENSLSQLYNQHWNKNEKFTEIVEQLPQRKLFKIYLNYSLIDDFTNTFLTEEDEAINMLANSLAFSIFDFDFTKDMIVLEGFANLDSSGSYAQALVNVNPGKLQAYKILSDQAAAYISISFENYSVFYNNLMNEYKKNYPKDAEDIDKGLELLEKVIKINIQEDFFSWIGNEIALCKIRPISTLSKQEDLAIIIHANDITKAQKGLANIVKQIRKWSPFKFQEFDYKGFTISFLKQKSFFKPLLGKLFEDIDEPYFTFIDNFVVFSNSEEVLLQIIDDYLAKRTLEKDEKFTGFLDEFDAKSNISLFILMPKMYPTLYYFTPTEDRASLTENQELIISFARVGFQLTSKDGMFKTTLKAQYDPDSYYEDLTVKLVSETKNDLLSDFIDTLGFIVPIPEDQEDGVYQTYYDPDNINLKTTGQVLNGKQSGLWRTFFPDGALESSINYEKGEPKSVGYFYYNDDENTMRTEVIFENGLCSGEYKEFYDNGIRKAVINYEKGKKEGNAEYFYRSGIIKIEAKYNKGKEDGKWTFYDDKGQKILVQKWKDGVMTKEKEK